jgi:hypothetical protein
LPCEEEELRSGSLLLFPTRRYQHVWLLACLQVQVGESRLPWGQQQLEGWTSLSCNVTVLQVQCLCAEVGRGKCEQSAPCPGRSLREQNSEIPCKTWHSTELKSAHPGTWSSTANNVLSKHLHASTCRVGLDMRPQHSSVAPGAPMPLL